MCPNGYCPVTLGKGYCVCRRVVESTCPRAGTVIRTLAVATFEGFPVVLITLLSLNAELQISALGALMPHAPRDMNSWTTVRVWHMFPGSVKVERLQLMVAHAK